MGNSDDDDFVEPELMVVRRVKPVRKVNKGSAGEPSKISKRRLMYENAGFTGPK